MVKTAKKYDLQFTALSISKEIQLEMPIWSHIGLNEKEFGKISHRKAVKCLRQKHKTHSVRDILQIAQRRTTIPRHPHMINPSGMSRKNCGCPPCKRERTEYGCEDSGECVEAAKAIIACLHPKWNPLVASNDLCETLALTDGEIVSNRSRDGDGCKKQGLIFDSNYRLTELSNGFRVFATDAHMTQRPARRVIP
ncbi:hypothetical protein FB45DRAFT_1102919, partial [Roridomyces roridus]